MKIRNCELCSESAAVYCPSDAAYLCRSCDAKVHDANFLVARHVRQTLTGNTFPANSDSDSDCESACVSSTTSPPAKEYSGGKRDSRSSSSEVSSRNSQSMSVNYCKVEGILVNWGLKLGLERNGDVAVRTALRACLDNRTKVLPFRVLLAASMWLGLKLKSVDTWRVLKRLEEISGVPAKIILAAESKLAREMRDERRQNRRRLELEEGWAEC